MDDKRRSEIALLIQSAAFKDITQKSDLDAKGTATTIASLIGITTEEAEEYIVSFFEPEKGQDRNQKAYVLGTMNVRF